MKNERHRVRHPLLLALALAAAAAGCAAGSGPPSGSSGDPPAMMPEGAAPQAFLANCAACHGATGEGSVSAPQILNPVVGYATYVVRTGRDEMGFPAAMPSFSAEQLPDDGLGEILDWLGKAEKPADGEGLFHRFCANCHGSDGLGGRVGKNIVKEAAEGPGEIFEEVREGHGGEAYGNRTKYMPAWDTAALTDAEATKIAEYLGTLPGGGGGDDDDD